MFDAFKPPEWDGWTWFDRTLYLIVLIGGLVGISLASRWAYGVL